MHQKTLKNYFSLEGIGLHSGQQTKILVKPAAANTGITFIKEGQRIPALLPSIKATHRGTTLNGIATVEHLLSAAYAIGLDNLEIEVFGEELPALDGSALPYVEAIEKAGILEQAKPKNFITIKSPIQITEGGTSLSALPYRGFKINFMLDFKGVGKQAFSFELLPDSYKKEIAPARTFGYLDEYEELKAKGLALGASLENALVVGKDSFANPPRFPDEMVRHKILDLIGDLALLGRPLRAEIQAEKSGHKLNALLARRILENG